MLISDLDRPRRVLLDTHVWVWASGNAGGPSRFAAWIAPKLETAARERRLLASAASVWEIALKAQRGELFIAGDLRTWVREQSAYPGIEVMAITTAVAIESTLLPPWNRSADGKPHKDPNDRFLVATARRKNAALVTCDQIILDYARTGHLLACDARR